MSHELIIALAALNLHRNGEVFWMSYDAEIADEELGIDEPTTDEVLHLEERVLVSA